jgi:hypothetical protein
MHLRAQFLLALLLLSFGPFGALAQPVDPVERITGFSSDITIAPDGTLTVEETIAVNVQGNVFQRGIFRDFPTLYTDQYGNNVRVGYDVLRVTRDGRDEPYALENLTNGRRVRIGNADVLLEHGIHVYSITYTTTRQIGFFEDHDELYWNVTGNGWEFPIDSAEAVVRLPGAEITQFAYYTGPQGSRELNAAATRLSADAVRFNTTEPLGPYEGLTVVVGFPKGVVTPPTELEAARSYLRDNAANGVALFGLLALFAYYYYVWWRVGARHRHSAFQSTRRLFPRGDALRLPHGL